MASYDDYMAALPRVTYKGQASNVQREAIAHTLAGTHVPPEHIGSLSAIHAGVNMSVRSAALYNHDDGSMLLPGDPNWISQMGGGIHAGMQRSIAHETGHRFSHIANPVQFANYVHHPEGRGILEASAENYADQAVPGSYSSYDYTVSRGGSPNVAKLDANSYRRMRGQRFGNIDPRLRQQ